tara:strand:- start:277 stop:1629 length:1353 start_codon:yes stop_codon:yes gene_type:complete
MKKFFTYPVFLVLVLSIIGSIFFGALLRHHYLQVNDERFRSLKKVAVFFAEMPMRVKTIVKNRTINLNKLQPLEKHKNKKRFEKFISNTRNALLVLPRYDHSKSRSQVDIIDLNNFKVIHSYKHDTAKMNSLVKNRNEFPRLDIDDIPVRFIYIHPLILEDGSLISFSRGPAFKIDFCSNLNWINDEEVFHHSLKLDHEGNIWVGGQFNPHSINYVKDFQIEGFIDDSIIKINSNGKILYKKSIIEILIENKILPNNYALTSTLSGQKDPIHLNYIEPAFYDTQHWKKGDVFLSIRHQSAIIHYRPSTNKVINYITGPFSQQHDVDIISDKEISIFNNNNFIVKNNYSEVLIYNFETKKFRKLHNDKLQNENFKTETQGMSQILNDGALMVEEQNHGRIILFDNKGRKEWEFVNKDKNGRVGTVTWSRIIEDKLFIEKYKSLVDSKKCTN